MAHACAGHSAPIACTRPLVICGVFVVGTAACIMHYATQAAPCVSASRHTSGAARIRHLFQAASWLCLPVVVELQGGHWHALLTWHVHASCLFRLHSSLPDGAAGAGGAAPGLQPAYRHHPGLPPGQQPPRLLFRRLPGTCLWRRVHLRCPPCKLCHCVIGRDRNMQYSTEACQLSWCMPPPWWTALQ